MARTRVLGFATLLAGALALGACSDSTAPKLAPLTVDSLLTELAETQAYGAAGGIFTGFVPIAATPGSSCVYQSAGQRFVCPSMTIDGFTTNRYYQLLDGSGAPQTEFNRSTTAAFRSVSDVEGSMTVEIPADEFSPGGTMTFTVVAHDDQTLSGLLTGTHVLNGSGNSTTTIDFDGEVVTFGMQTTTTNLVLPRRGSSQKYPQSGTIAMTISADGETANLTMTFNGTSKVTIVISADGFTLTCTYDLDNPEAEPVCT